MPASCTPSSTEASARYSASVRSTATSSRLTSPAIATLPSSSWRVAMRRASRVGASSTGPPNMPGVHGVVQDLDLDGAVHQAAQAGGQRRDADLPVAGVGHHDHVGAQQFAVGFQEGPERRRAGLLLAFEEEGHAEAQVVAQHPGHRRVGRDVGQDAGLVVGRAAAVEPAVAFDGGERLGLPQRRIARGLDVVVGVEQDGRLALGGGPAGDDGRPAGRAVFLVAAQDPDIVEAAGPHQPGDGVGAGVQRGGIEAGPGDARDGDEVLQLADRGVKRFGHGLAEGLGVDVPARAGSGLRVPRG